MRRRDLVAALAGAVLGVASPAIRAFAQRTGKVYRIGFLTSGGAFSTAGKAIAEAIAAHGYRLDDNLIVESRSSQDDPGRLPGLVRELAALPVDVIVTFSYPAARAASAGVRDMPIVVIGSGDPVATGLVPSLARPGGNITGISDVAAELAPKRLELLKTIAPSLKKVAMLWNADDLGMSLRFRSSSEAATTLGIEVQSLGVREPGDFAQAFAAMDGNPPDGILMVSDALTFLNRQLVFDYAAVHRLPVIYEAENWARAGGLMSYGPEGREVVERAAALIDRILKGGKPADLPFEEPTRFRLVINLPAAKALGLTVPPLLLAQANEVIE